MSSEIPMIIMLFIILITLLFLLMMKKKRQAMITRRLPPGPKKLPVIGNLHQLGKLPHRSLQIMSKRYGELMFLQLGSVPALVVSSPDMAREIFKNHDLVFSGRPPLYAAKRFTYNLSSISLAPYGEYWRQVRKILVLELMTAKRVESFGQVRVQEVALTMERISSNAPKVVDLSSLMFSLSNNVVCRVAFGKMNPSDVRNNSRFQEILGEAQHLMGEFNIADYFPWMGWVNKINRVDRRLEKNFWDIDKFFDQVIEEHLDPIMRPESDSEDIIDVLLRIQKDTNQTINLSDEQLKGVLMDIFVAGTDTSTATIIWTMAELIRNPHVKQKVQQELRQAVQGKTKIQESDLPNLPYLKLVIKESLRLHPPAPLLVPRETTKTCTIATTETCSTVADSYDVPAKTRVFFNCTAMSADPAYWEDPEKFWPERFMDRPQVDFRGQHFELLPFGAGRRGCPGINFAMPVVELALANLLFCFDWELPAGMSPEDVDMEEAPGITMHKKTPLCLVASPVNCG
ncbi:UNVERIFIED_CONTAM: cytochrome [Sesamum latifolium]|uniref:Cytochrome n=1 Tax=Sesamum latifolium TaxID=2727402 RepID=A0AAW2UJV4_9LAMI